MEFELPKINVSFEYDEEKDEIVFVINGVEKRVKTEDMITEMEKMQEQNTALEQQPCEDCISRQAVLDGINQYIDKAQSSGVIDAFISFETLVVKEIPSIQPKPKMGHWEQYGYSWKDKFKCSECGEEQPKILCGERIIGDWSDFCPNCGVKMESEG